MTTRSQPSSLAVLVLAAVLLVVSGCESTSNWLKGRKTHSGDDEQITLGEPASGTYVNDLYSLINGDPATQAEIYADARSRAELTPNPSTKLHYALVLAAPGHSASNELEAQSMFRELLAQTELLSPVEISMATIHLNEVEQRLVLGAEARRLRSENTRAAGTEDAAIEQRIVTVEAENRRLRRSLADAESKLDAITSIERSVRESSDGE